jgi:predicted AAA+ superfamily ATPase
MPENDEREENNLLLIRDNYEKIIITANRMDVGNIKGIPIIFITDFLLEKY